MSDSIDTAGERPATSAAVEIPASEQVVADLMATHVEVEVPGVEERERSFDELAEERAPSGDRAEPPPTGLAVLDELTGAPADEASAESSYGYDRALAEEGKWFRWPKLGPRARLKLRKVGCAAWKALMDRARARYGDEEGKIAPKTMEKIIDPLIAKGLWVEMEGVVVKLGEPAMADTLENRLRLLEMFHPDLGNDVFKTCNSPRNFRDASEEVLGN